ncbi:NfeD family protein [Paenibacillus endoradicis]|uniref:NfeD family protein n=1 Tax=Paenibacillus endoradicis TaxID=2972487 RepID=UPI0021590C8C|nr:NfeD family protein [Paenibacillus endoradicis]MCR8659218.1 ATP-dependent Clp protease proteolytic subunit [Paenibacillus endoradicis]
MYSKFSIHRFREMLTVFVISLFAILLVTGLIAPSFVQAESKSVGPAVYEIPLKGTVDQSMVTFLERAFSEAEEAHASHIVIVLNTYGGRVDSANEIGELVRAQEIPVTVFVEGKAVSAGTYIALNADYIAMQSGSTIGSAAVVDSNGTLSDNPKTISFWVDQMQEVARLHGRDTNVAAAMVDPRVEIDLTDTLGKVKSVGDVIAISASEALRIGYSDFNVETVVDVLNFHQLGGRDVITITPSAAENVASFLVNPIVSTILLILGFAGLAIELFVPGLGLPGILGGISMGLFFFGSFVSGLAGMETVVLFIVGLILIVLELIVPAFGILGLLGGGAIITGILLASPDWESGLTSIGIALVIAIILVVIVSRTKKGRSVWNKLVLRENLTTEEGFISAESKDSLLGLQGVTVTPLRPAGAALIDNKRVDVVTEGGFIELNRPVVVIKAEGTWVVVREVKENV